MHNKGICMNTSPVSNFLVENPASVKYNAMHQMTTREQTQQAIAFLDKSKEHPLSCDRTHFTFNLGNDICSLRRTLLLY